MNTAVFSLGRILSLVGQLDDVPGPNAARERFRQFLQSDVEDVGQVRDFIEECLRTPGDQYSRALQDLVNYLGRFLGFDVAFGRYQGVHGQNGFDGHWTSNTGFHVVVETKTTEVYAIRTSALVGYVDGLISEHQIPNWDQALGLYVVGKPDKDIRQLENAIVAERRTHQLRVVSVESLLSLAEMAHNFDVTHEDILALLRPSGPRVDAVVDLMARLVAGPRAEQPEDIPPPPLTQPIVQSSAGSAAPKASLATAPSYWLTPVSADDAQTAEDVVRILVSHEHIYAFGDHTPGRKHLKQGDWIGFYATGNGVVACARLASSAKQENHPRVRHPEKWRWVVHLDNVKTFVDAPVVIDSTMRSKLDSFQGRNPKAAWAWYVQATRRITEHDFQLLTR